MLTLSLTPISMVRSLKMIPSIPDMEASFPEMSDYSRQGLVKGAELCLNPYFFGWLEK